MTGFSFGKNTKVEITYHGGLGENLTGSSKLLSITIGTKIYNILIDAGSRQGGLDQDKFNDHMPIDPKSIYAIVLTHAHMDHIGKVPLYVRNGFTGPIYTTPITKPLIFEALKDEQKIFQRILEEKKEILTKLKKAFNIVKRHQASNFEGGAKIKKHGEQKTAEIKKKHTSSTNMLQRNNISSITDIRKYENAIQTMEEQKERSEQDLFKVMGLIKTAPYNKVMHIVPRVASATFYNAGHIEGSAQVDIEVAQKNFLFSGDLGRIHDNFIVGKPVIPKKNKYSFISLESTYAGKVHPNRKDAEDHFYNEIANTHGPVIAPTFALQRILEGAGTALKGGNRLNETQESIYSDRASKKDIEGNNKKIRIIDTIYIDAPLGKKYKEIFLKELGSKYSFINTSKVKFVTVTERQELLLRIKKGHRLLIFSSSGMLQGGTVMHYLPEILKQKKGKIIFTGFPGQNTLASQIVSGNKKVVVNGLLQDVTCESIYIEGFSSHADHDELVEYFQGIKKAKGAKVALEHGGINRNILAEDIKNGSVKVIIPQEGDKFRIL